MSCQECFTSNPCPQVTSRYASSKLPRCANRRTPVCRGRFSRGLGRFVLSCSSLAPDNWQVRTLINDLKAYGTTASAEEQSLETRYVEFLAAVARRDA